MRYFIKAYPMHEEELHAIEKEVSAGTVEGEVGSDLVVGTADLDAIERMADAGIVVQTLGIVAEDEPDGSSSKVRTVPADPHANPLVRSLFGRSTVLRRAAVADAILGDSGPRYWLADLLAGVTDKTTGRLAEAGAEIVERDPTGAFVLRTSGRESSLEALPFVRNLVPYVAETPFNASAGGIVENLDDDGQELLIDGFGDTALLLRRAPLQIGGVAEGGASDGPSVGRFEVICHEPKDRESVAAAINDLGGTVVASTGRVVRFLLNRTDLYAVALVRGVASVSAAKSPGLRCDQARRLIGLDHAALPTQLPFDGAGELVGVADTGLDEDHADFDGKRVTVIALGRPGDGSDPDGHGTHVAGTIAGTGKASRSVGDGPGSPAPLRGVAPAADIYFQSVLDVNGELGGLPESLISLLQPAYDAGVRIHNNSWGAYIQSRYDGMAVEIDEFVYEHPDFLAVIAAGNEGSCLPGLTSASGFVDLPSLGSPATAKNGITVGASRSDRTSGGYAQMTWQEVWPEDFNASPIGAETISGDPQGLAAFSSRGPCDDFRIKPDLVAPGTDIAAPRSKKAPLSNFWGAYPRNRRYAFMGGTSMACPIVTGCAALVRQYYRTQRAISEPSAALLKATLINGTTLLNGADAMAAPNGEPNYHQGFGCIDMARTLPDPADPDFDLFFVDTWKQHPQRRINKRVARLRWRFHVETACELRITVAWTDFGARALQNQLRVILDTRRGGNTINWIANENAAQLLWFPAHDPRNPLPGQNNVLSRDPQNNVQVIRTEVHPGAYTLAIFADGLIKLPQDFALVATYPLNAIEVEDA